MRREGDIVCSTHKEIKMADKSSEDIELDKRAAERAAAHKEMKLAVGSPTVFPQPMPPSAAEWVIGRWPVPLRTLIGSRPTFFRGQLTRMAAFDP
jgi:hypothetical protein